MSEDDLKAKFEFVEKMKQENPRAFGFLTRGATNLLLDLENDLVKEFNDWVERAIKVMGIEKTRALLRSKSE